MHFSQNVYKKNIKDIGDKPIADTVAVTTRIPVEDKDRLDKLASATGRTKAFIIANAIQNYLEHEAWQIEETTQALKEANAGDFATDEETEAFFAKWKA